MSVISVLGDKQAGIIPKNRKLRKKKVAHKNKTIAIRKGSKHDWISIRTQFIEGIPRKDEKGELTDEKEFPTLKALAELNSVSYGVLRERSAVESWLEQRESYQLRLAKSRQLARINMLSKKSIEFDEKSLKLADIGMTIVLTRLGELMADISGKKQLRERALEAIKHNRPIELDDLESAIDAKELVSLASATQIWQTVGTKALGSDVVKHEISIDANLDVDIRQLTMAQELGRDDPERLAQLFNVAERAGVFKNLFDNESIEDADIVDEDEKESGNENE